MHYTIVSVPDRSSPQYNLLDQWTQFLITDSLIPANQISTDDFAGSLANQTNLAIKGIVGIKAMSQIASLAGKASVSSNYSVGWSDSLWCAELTCVFSMVVYCVVVCHAMADVRDVKDWASSDPCGETRATPVSR